MLFIDHHIHIESPTAIPIPQYIKPFFFSEGRSLIMLLDYERDFGYDMVILGTSALAIFDYGGRIPSGVYSGTKSYPILWYQKAFQKSGKIIQDGEWWTRWRQKNKIRSREFRKIRATLFFDTESEMGMFSFHKKGIFIVEADVLDRPGTLNRVTQVLSGLRLDILNSESRVNSKGMTMTLKMLCGASHPASKEEIHNRLQAETGDIVTSIRVEGEAITIDDLQQVNESFSNLFSVFISYSHADREFALKLYDFLVNSGVKCWMDSHEFVPGVKIHETIRKGIMNYDRFLLICSASSLQSWWVDNELEIAIAKERELKETLLIPIDIDGAIFDGDQLNDKCQQIKSRFIGDFTGWEKQPKFDYASERLFRALKPNE